VDEGRAAEDLGPHLGDVPNVTCLVNGGAGPGFDILRAPLQASTATHISVFDPHVFYGRQFLTDLMSAFVYADADIAGKAAHFSYDPVEHRLSVCSPDLEHTWVGTLPASGFLASVEAFERVWSDRERSGTLGTVRASAGLKLYSADRFNYAVPADRRDFRVPKRVVAFAHTFRHLVEV
jgi:hypothetical protein